MEVAKFAVAGTVIGVGAGIVADVISSDVLIPIMRPTPGTQPSAASQTGRLVFQVVAGSLLAGGIIYGGDRLMDMLVTGDDPLYRTFYTLSAFNSMRLTQQNMSGINSIYQMLLQQIRPPAPKTTSAPANAKSGAKPCCG